MSCLMPAIKIQSSISGNKITVHYLVADIFREQALNISAHRSVASALILEVCIVIAKNTP